MRRLAVFIEMKFYLYDIMKIKKETSTLFQSNDFTQ